MKFALVVLLGLCAVVAQAAVVRDDPPVASLEITDAIRQKIEEFMEKAKQHFEVVRQKVKEIAKKNIEKLKRIVEQGKAKFAEYSKHFEDKVAELEQNKVAELEQKGGPSERCFEKHEAELDDVEKETEADLQKCIDGATESSIQDATKIPPQKSGEEISDVFECNQAAYTKSNEKLKEINEKIFQCYQDGQKN